jgi:hypothetical protein
VPEAAVAERCCPDAGDDREKPAAPPSRSPRKSRRVGVGAIGAVYSEIVQSSR